MLSLKTLSLLKFSESHAIRSFIEILKNDQILMSIANEDFWMSYIMKFGKVGRLISWQRGDVKTFQEWLDLIESIFRNESCVFCFLYNDIRDIVERQSLSVLDIPRDGTQLYVPVKCSVLGYRPASQTLGYACKICWYIEKYDDKICKNRLRLVLTSSTDDILKSTKMQRANMYCHYLRKLLYNCEFSHEFDIETLDRVIITYYGWRKIESHLSTKHSYDSLLKSMEFDYLHMNNENQREIKIELSFGPSFFVECEFKIHEIII